ncbi:MAG: alpha/beta hydrolase [Cyanobacteria bacterium SW_9_44_58]|nr:MAG: alpha/beta hydrolase [Cyanobacteria bacterium SW_9_44_58]
MTQLRQQQGQTINLRGIDHYYEWICDSSNGTNKPVLVFVHGWGGSGRYWKTTATALSDQFDCLIYDLRGFGRSSLPENHALSYDMEEYAEDLAVLLDKLQLEQVYLNAHSMGASLATLFISRYPQKVKQAILTCSGIFEYNPITFKLFHFAGTYVVKLRFNWFSEIPAMDRLFMARFLNRPIPKEERKAFLEDYLLADEDAAKGTIYTAVSKHASTVMPEAFANVSVPTLLVAGEKDIIIPTRLAKKAANLNANYIEYFELPDTAHFPMLEDAPNYLEKVRTFLQADSQS